MRVASCLMAAWIALPGTAQGQQPEAATPVQSQAGGGLSFSGVNDFLYQRNELATWEEKPETANRDPRRAQDQFVESLALNANADFGSGGNLATGVILRGTNVYMQRSDLTLAQTDASLYRKFLKYRIGGFSVEAGNFYAMLGRGLVLSVLPIDKLLKERSIEGGDLRFQNRWIDFRALAGKIQTETRDQAWRVEGGEFRVAYLQGPKVGVHRMGIHLAQISDVRTEKTDEYQVPLLRKRTLSSGSLSGDNLGGVLSYYAERATLTWERKPDDFMLIRPGEASYANLNLRVGNLYLMGEFQRYLRFESDLINPQNTLNNPPISDREDEKNNLVHSQVARLLIQYRFQDPDLSFFISGGQVKENEIYDPTQRNFSFDPVRDTGHSVYGGFTVEDLGDWLTLSATTGVRNIRYPEWRTDAASTAKFSRTWSLELKLRDKRHTDPLTATPYRESDYTAQISWAGHFSIYAMSQVRSDPGRNFTRDHLFSGGLRIQLYKSSYMDVSGGSIRGGLVCSGGQCRELPDFKGWKISTHLTF